MKYFIFSILLIFLLIAGCTPQLVCESPSSVIDDRCCLDENDNNVCDSDESELIQEPKILLEPVEPELSEPVKEPVLEPQLKTPPTTTEVVKEVEPQLKAGTFNIAPGESRKYIELNDLEMHRYSTNKIMLDYLWYTVRNIGGKTLNPEVRIRAEGIRQTNQESDGTSSREFTYILDSLDPGEKQVIKLALDIRFGQINKSRDFTLEVYERFVAPKEVKDKDVYNFVPYDELESTEIWWLNPED